MLTLIVFTVDEENLTIMKSDIFTSVIYTEAVRDSILK